MRKGRSIPSDSRINRSAIECAFYGASMILLLVASSPAGAGSSGELGDVCVQHFTPGALGTAQDIEVAQVIAAEVLDPCTSTEDTASVVLQLVLFSQSNFDRYDIGIFIATEGGSALSGNSCYHDYLDPPLSASPGYVSNGDGTANLVNGPWLDREGSGDLCGDMEQLTPMGDQAHSIKTLTPLTISCADPTLDGVVDLDICLSWDIEVDSSCTGLAGAVPLTNARAGCEPMSVTGLSIEPTTTTTSTTVTTTSTTLPGATLLDDYNCYKVKDLKNPAFSAATGVTVEDQFATSTIDIVKPALLCAPASKNGSAVSDPSTHICCYKTKAPALAAPVDAEVATAGLGTLQVQVKKSSLFCQPCSKSLLP